MRTRTIELIGLVASCLLLAGCASLGTPGPDGAPGADRDDGPAAPAATVDPVELVSLWRVLGAEDADAGDDPTWLRLDVGHYQLWRGCGFVEGAWEASAEALFVASAPFMSTEECVAGAPEPIDTAADFFTEPPEVTGGAWTVGADGRLRATAGVSTMIGCAGVPVGSWLASAGRVGLDGQTLVLLDDDGAELGRLARG